VVPDAAGVLVQSVEADTAASAFGILKGDIIKKVGDQDVGDVDALRNILSKLSAGDRLTVHVARGGQTIELKEIVLGAEGEKVTAPAAAATPKEPEKPKEVVEAKEPDRPATEPKKPGVLRFTAIDDPASGKVLVTLVNRGGPAEKGGLLKDDVVVRVNDKPVRNTDELAAVLRTYFAGDTVTLRVARGGEEKDIMTTLAAVEDAPRP
jgi:S1-C subfamily serine protease